MYHSICNVFQGPASATVKAHNALNKKGEHHEQRKESERMHEQLHLRLRKGNLQLQDAELPVWLRQTESTAITKSNVAALSVQAVKEGAVAYKGRVQ